MTKTIRLGEPKSTPEDGSRRGWKKASTIRHRPDEIPIWLRFQMVCRSSRLPTLRWNDQIQLRPRDSRSVAPHDACCRSHAITRNNTCLPQATPQAGGAMQPASDGRRGTVRRSGLRRSRLFCWPTAVTVGTVTVGTGERRSRPTRFSRRSGCPCNGRLTVPIAASKEQ